LAPLSRAGRGAGGEGKPLKVNQNDYSDRIAELVEALPEVHNLLMRDMDAFCQLMTR
jgi:hypothetical protein